MRLTQILIRLMLCILAPSSAWAADYYWVGGTGSWNDVNHWATASGGSTFHTVAPGSNDNVFFDANSFTAPSQTVTINLTTANCNHMSWAGATNSPTLNTTGGVTLSIFGDLLLIPGMTFTFGGSIIFTGNAGLNAVTTAGHTMPTVTFSGTGSVWTLQDPLTTSGSLTLTEGSLNTNGHDVSCGAFSSGGSSTRGLNISNIEVTAVNWTLNGTNLTFNGANSQITLNGTPFQHSGTGVNYHNLTCNANGSQVVAGNSSYNVINTGAVNALGLSGGATIDSVLSAGHLAISGTNQANYISATDDLIVAGTNQLTKGIAGGSLDMTGNNTFSALDVGRNGIVRGSHAFDSLRFNTVGSFLIVEEGQTQSINEHLFMAATCSQPGLIESTERGAAATFAMGGATFEMQHVSLRDLTVTGGPNQVTSNLINVANVTGITANATPLKLFWVGGSGDWSDVSHWSLSSGGAGGACIPREIDTVIFDGSSFTAGNTVTVDVQLARCATMNWTAAGGSPTFVEGAEARELRIYGSLWLIAPVNFDFTRNIAFEALSGGNAIETNGVILDGAMIFKGIGGEWTFLDDCTTNDTVLFHHGTINLNSNDLECEAFFSSSANPRVLNMANSTITANGPASAGQAVWIMNGASLTLNAANSLIECYSGDFIHVGSPKQYHNVDMQILTGPRSLEGGASSFNLIQCWAASTIGFLQDDNTIDSLVLYSGEMEIQDQQTINVAYMDGESRIIDDPVITHYEVFQFADFDPGAQATIQFSQFYNDGRIRGTNVFDTLILEPGYLYRWGSNQTQTVNLQFVADGNCAEIIYLEATITGTAATIQANTGISTDYTSLRDMTIAGTTPAVATNSVDLGNNTGWNISTANPLTLYWVGGTGVWNDVNHWSFTSGGPGGACIPTAIDTAIFDQNSFAAASDTVYINVGNAVCATMDWSAITLPATLTATNPANVFRIFASLYLSNLMNFQFLGDFYFEGVSTGFSIDPATQEIKGIVHFVGQGGEWTLLDKLEVDNEIIHQYGSLISNQRQIECTRYYSNFLTTRGLDITGDTVRVSGSEWFMDGSGLTLQAAQSFIRVQGFNGFYHVGTPRVYNNVRVNGQVLNGGNSRYNVVETNVGQITGSNRIDTLIVNGTNVIVNDADTINYLESNATISMQGAHQVVKADFYQPCLLNGSNYFQNAYMHENGTMTGSNLVDSLTITNAKTYFLGANQTQDYGAIFSNWNPCFPITWRSNVPGIQANMRLLNDTLHSDFMEIRDINHLGPLPFYAGNFGIDQGNNTNIQFISEPDFAFGFRDDTLFFQCGTVVQPVSITANFFSPDSVVWGNGQTGNTVTFTPPDTIWYKVYYGTCVFEDTLRAGLQTFVPIVHQSQADTTICSSDSVTLTADASGTGFSFLWNTTDTTQSITVSPPTNTQYVVTVTRSGQSCSDSIEVNVATAPPLTILDDTINCPGDTLIFDAGPGFDSYSWSNGDTTQTTQYQTAGTHLVTAIKDGCTRQDSFYLHINNPIDFDLFALAASCNGFSDGSAYIDTVTLDPNYTFQWQGGTAGIGQLTNLAAGFYRITVASGPDCSRIDSVEVTEPPVPVIQANITPTTCFGSTDGAIALSTLPDTHQVVFTWQVVPAPM